MGVKRRRQQYRLVFEQPEHMAGLEVICWGPTRSQLFRIAKLGNVDLDNLQGEGVEQLDQLCGEMGDRLISWNYEDEQGTALPATRATLDAEDPDFTLPLVRAWMQTCMGATPDADVQQHDPQPQQFEGQTTVEEQLASLDMLPV